jgi:hypothetical protein
VTHCVSLSLHVTGCDNKGSAKEDNERVVSPLAQSELWESFLKQRDQIPTDKWIQSRNAGHDIGMERAIRDWLQKNQDLWYIRFIEPECNPLPRQGTIRCRERLGGMLRYYYRQAA